MQFHQTDSKTFRKKYTHKSCIFPLDFMHVILSTQIIQDINHINSITCFENVDNIYWCIKQIMYNIGRWFGNKGVCLDVSKTKCQMDYYYMDDIPGF